MQQLPGIPTLLVIVNSWKRCSIELLVLLNETTNQRHRSLLSFLNLADRRRNSRLSLMYKSLHSLAGISTSPFRRSSKPTHSADGGTFCVLSSRTDPYKYSCPRTIVDWNALPASVNSGPSIHSFRCAIHSSLTNSIKPHSDPGSNGWQLMAGYHQRTEELRVRFSVSVISGELNAFFNKLPSGGCVWPAVRVVCHYGHFDHAHDWPCVYHHSSCVIILNDYVVAIRRIPNVKYYTLHVGKSCPNLITKYEPNFTSHISPNPSHPNCNGKTIKTRLFSANNAAFCWAHELVFNVNTACRSIPKHSCELKIS